MRLANRALEALLRSPVHRLFSSGIGVVRYRGRQSGRVFTTPVQYAQRGETIIIVVGRPRTKTWWRNFRRGHDMEFLRRGRWLRLRAEVVLGSEQPDEANALLDVYLQRFPKAARRLPDTTAARSNDLVIVRADRAEQRGKNDTVVHHP